MRILVVEDEIITSMWLEAVLTKMGYTVIDKLVSGEEAVRVALQERPDLITMDINLVGDMNGIEAARKIQETERIPVVFMTGYVDKHFQKAAEEIYSPAFLFKPVKVEVLQNTLDEHFNK